MGGAAVSQTISFYLVGNKLGNYWHIFNNFSLFFTPGCGA
jgi:hypothetical protein